MRKVLTEEQIERAKELKEHEGYTKRSLALEFGVGITTIWENVYSTKKRIRVFTRKPYIPKTYCKCCEVIITRQIKGRYIPTNFQIGDKCLRCHLEAQGIPYTALLNLEPDHASR